MSVTEVLKNQLRTETHCFELFRDIFPKNNSLNGCDGKPRWNVVGAGYTASGVAFKVKDEFDGQEYRLEISPSKS